MSKKSVGMQKLLRETSLQEKMYRYSRTLWEKHDSLDIRKAENKQKRQVEREKSYSWHWARASKRH
jgi:hypothetical protein